MCCTSLHLLSSAIQACSEAERHTPSLYNWSPAAAEGEAAGGRQHSLPFGGALRAVHGRLHAAVAKRYIPNGPILGHNKQNSGPRLAQRTATDEDMMWEGGRRESRPNRFSKIMSAPPPMRTWCGKQECRESRSRQR